MSHLACHLDRRFLGLLRPRSMEAARAFGLALAFTAAPVCAGEPSEQRARGQALFEGRVELRGQIRGHADRLPTEALRCINCHARVLPEASAGSPGRLGNSQAFGPVLDSAWLTGQRPRRGAPASAYDARALCTALRDGLDPQQVRMSRNMPLYDFSSVDCDALWAFLAEGPRR